MASRHMKRCSVSLITREIQVRAAVSYHLPPVRMTITKRPQIKRVDEGVQKREPSYTVDGNANRYSHYGKQYRGSSLN